MIDRETAYRVYEEFKADPKISRRELEWVRRKLRAYCGKPVTAEELAHEATTGAGRSQ
jgi:DNA-directed RNA polymerase specialized sigma24 family protein